MEFIKKFEQFVNEEGYFESDYSSIPDNILDHWLYHYDLWCKENGQLPEYDSVEEIKDDSSAIDHVYYHADIYAQKHGFKLDGVEYMEPEEITEKLITDDEELLEGKVSDVETVGNNLKYRNEHFPGWNQPKRYEGKKKYKFRVLAREGEKVKIINFGKLGDDKKQLSKLSKKYWEATWRR